MKQKFEPLSKLANAQLPNNKRNAILGGAGRPTTWEDSDGRKGSDSNTGGNTKWDDKWSSDQDSK